MKITLTGTKFSVYVNRCSAHTKHMRLRRGKIINMAVHEAHGSYTRSMSLLHLCQEKHTVSFFGAEKNYTTPTEILYLSVPQAFQMGLPMLADMKKIRTWFYPCRQAANSVDMEKIRIWIRLKSLRTLAERKRIQCEIAFRAYA